MIHVVCPNPAIDKLYAIDDFAPGEDYPGQRPTVRFGGKGVNVARVLSQLGAQTALYAFMGEESETGFLREMKKRLPRVRRWMAWRCCEEKLVPSET